MSRHRTTRSHEKGSAPKGSAYINTALVEAVEERLLSHSNRDKAGQWRLSKKKPGDRADLVRIARNLDLMLCEVPHGSLGNVLEAAGFSDSGGEVHGYRGNIAIPHSVINVEDKRLRRLSPVVQRYVDVALQVESDRAQALSRLFSGTSLDRGPTSASDRDWADRLADALAAMTAKIAVQTELGPLFDRLSRENLQIAEDFGAEGMLDDERTPELRVTDWLSETFHKTDFFGLNPREASWFFDRTDEGTPLCGPALFCPKVCIIRAEHDWAVELEGPEPLEPAVLRTLVRDYLALVPIAETLETPARVAPWLLRRPEAFLRIDDAEEYQIMRIEARGDDRALIMYDSGADEYDTVVATLPERLRAPWAIELFVDTGQHPSASPDLAGCWHGRPAIAEHLRQSMSEQLDEDVEIVQLTSLPQHGDLIHVVAHADALDTVDWNALEPGIFAPWGSASAAMQHALRAGELAARLADAIHRLAAGYRELHHRLITSSPIAEEMLRQG